MSCNCCCTNTLNFCEQNVCGEIDFDIKAQISGVHNLVTYYLGMKLTISETFSVDDNIIFPLDKLNENFQYTVQLYDPNGAKIIIRKDNIDYDCFKFMTVINFTLTTADVMES